MSFSRASCAFCLVAGAAAALTDKVAVPSGTDIVRSTNGRVDNGDTAGASWFGGKVARFGGPGLSGSLQLQLTSGHRAVQWTTGKITVPAQLIQDVCGDFPDEQTFTYSINEKWRHFFQSHAQGVDCGERWTGLHWDPTAACGTASGNTACRACHTQGWGYHCNPGSFRAEPDAAGSYAYRFMNKEACELGDLSGMKGELEARVPEDNETESVTIPALYQPGGLAQMSAPFGQVSRESVTGGTIGVNCDSSGPPAAHATNCGCLRHNHKRSRSVGSLTVFRGEDHGPFYLGGSHLSRLNGKSIVVQCGSTFGDKAGTPVFCAKLQ